MKLTLLIATLAATAIAASRANGDMVPAEADIEARADNCFFPSQCSAFWFGKCENHCSPRGFSHMTRDGCRFTKKCCCIRP